MSMSEPRIENSGIVQGAPGAVMLDQIMLGDDVTFLVVKVTYLNVHRANFWGLS